jgi:pentatricopeptide repeat protein
MKILKKEVNNVPVTIIKTDKFKQVAGRLYFKSPVSKSTITNRMMLRNMLMESCKKYDTSEKLYIKSLECYDASLYASSSRVGNYHITSFTFSTLIDKYTKEGNLKDVIDLFCEIIFNPLVSNFAFDQDTFDLIYETKKSALEKIKEDSSSYIERQVLKNLDENKAYTYMSDLKYLNKITSKSLYDDYLDMINNSSVSLILAGDIDFDNPIIDIITSKIKKNKKFDAKLLIDNDKEKIENKVITEDFLGTQNIINYVLYLKNLTDFERNYVAPLYRIILGGGVSSRLFSIIREENKLAYYSFARYEKDDSLMYIIMGIEKENFDKAYKLTNKIIDEMKNISDEEVLYAKRSYITSYMELQDKITNVIGSYNKLNLFDIKDDNELIENINKVTKEDIEKFAYKIYPHLCYFLKGE